MVPVNLLRRQKKAETPRPPSLKDVWRGFQLVLALNHEITARMGDLEGMLSSPEGLKLDSWRSQIDLLGKNLVELVAALQGMCGGSASASSPRSWRTWALKWRFTATSSGAVIAAGQPRQPRGVWTCWGASSPSGASWTCTGKTSPCPRSWRSAS